MFTSLKIKLYFMMPFILALAACHSEEQSGPDSAASFSSDPAAEASSADPEADHLKCNPLGLDQPGLDVTIYGAGPGVDGQSTAIYKVISGGKFQGAAGDVIEEKTGTYIFTSGPLKSAHASIIDTIMPGTKAPDIYHLSMGLENSECFKY